MPQRRILVAGASGAIGTPLITRLVAQGYLVFGVTRSDRGARHLASLGASPVLLDLLNAQATLEAVQQAQPEIVIDMVTSLPKEYTPQAMRAAGPQNDQVRLVGGANLHEAAIAAGAHRYIAQSSAFWYVPGGGLATEETPFVLEGPPGIAAGSKVYRQIEDRVLNDSRIEGVALRFGFFYGPGTWYAPGGSMAQQVQNGSYSIVGEGRGVWNFLHIDDAAQAVSLALDGPPGAYNIVGNTPVEMAVWLPAYARWLGAPIPATRTVEEEMQIHGPDSVYYAMSLRGASNKKAKQLLSFHPRPLEWLEEPA